MKNSGIHQKYLHPVPSHSLFAGAVTQWQLDMPSAAQGFALGSMQGKKADKTKEQKTVVETHEPYRI
jgi:hypothetical protein